MVSELTRDDPSPHVIGFLADHDDLWLSSMVIHELEYGLRLLPAGRRRDCLIAMVSNIVTMYEDRILALDKTGTEWSARFRAQERCSGRVLDLGNTLIAGITRANDLAVAPVTYATSDSSLSTSSIPGTDTATIASATGTSPRPSSTGRR